jgi:hypothetical protein
MDAVHEGSMNSPDLPSGEPVFYDHALDSARADRIGSDARRALSAARLEAAALWWRAALAQEHTRTLRGDRREAINACRWRVRAFTRWVTAAKQAKAADSCRDGT